MRRLTSSHTKSLQNKPTGPCKANSLQTLLPHGPSHIPPLHRSCAIPWFELIYPWQLSTTARSCSWLCSTRETKEARGSGIHRKSKRKCGTEEGSAFAFLGPGQNFPRPQATLLDFSGWKQIQCWALQKSHHMFPPLRCLTVFTPLMKNLLAMAKKNPPALFEGEIKCFINSKMVEIVNQNQNIQV